MCRLPLFLLTGGKSRGKLRAMKRILDFLIVEPLEFAAMIVGIAIQALVVLVVFVLGIIAIGLCV